MNAYAPISLRLQVNGSPRSGSEPSPNWHPAARGNGPSPTSLKDGCSGQMPESSTPMTTFLAGPGRTPQGRPDLVGAQEVRGGGRERVGQTVPLDRDARPGPAGDRGLRPAGTSIEAPPYTTVEGPQDAGARDRSADRAPRSRPSGRQELPVGPHAVRSEARGCPSRWGWSPAGRRSHRHSSRRDRRRTSPSPGPDGVPRSRSSAASDRARRAVGDAFEASIVLPAARRASRRGSPLRRTGTAETAMTSDAARSRTRAETDGA